MTYLHGVEVLEIDTGTRPIAVVRSSVIGIVGTAPDSASGVKSAASIGTAAANNGLSITAKAVGVAGNNISIRLVDPAANSSALAVTVDGNAITISLATSGAGAVTTTGALLLAAINAHAGASALVTAAALAGSTGAGVAVAGGRLFLSGGEDEAFPLNTPTLVAGSQREAARLGTAGTLPAAMDGIFAQVGAVVVVVRVEEGEDAEETLANVLGGVNAGTGDYEGIHAFLGAESRLGVAPRILLAPGFTHQRAGSANAVVAALVGIADRLRATVLADGPNTTDAAAMTYANDFGSARVYMCDPWVKRVDREGAIVQAPPSPYIAGVMAKSDADNGFWRSPSNQTIAGIVGTVRPVDFVLGDPNCRANLLNEAGIATIINQDGYRLWGNRSLSSDPKWSFLSIRRTADMVNESLLRAHLWAVDMGITAGYVDAVTDGVNAFLRSLRSSGAIINGRCWADEDLNTPEAIADGNVFFDFDFSGTYPAERITFRSRLTNDYLTEIF
ncbi:MAG: phage tail protein [Sphingopyxis macrogoltabida]|uniref:Phage tail protein n=1 Tax=Sphingopyxis macrogoltabida TaxID=33050 RepID=A0A2W5KVX7_SPHMC|nr:MAG: phage tail protein [Sphingopyxis macrogoltabida]